MTTVCLSIFEHSEPQALSNHQYYCSRMGYEHVKVSMQGLTSSAHKLVFKYELLLHQLRKMEEGELLISTTEDCVFFLHAAGGGYGARARPLAGGNRW